ncbi:MAG: transcription-repair coupling factor [Gemmatimonadetes bacterium]|nr:transcription-repair coupling factor [Gemmatimonadota bacterium]
MSSLPHPVLEGMASCPAFQGLDGALPGPGEARRIGGATGSTPAAILATLHEHHPDRLFVAVARDPQAATAIESDLEVLIGPGVSHLYPQHEALPYESTETHLEIGGLRVEAVEALFSGNARLLVTTLRALQERAPVPEGLVELRITLQIGEEVGFQWLIDSLEARGFKRAAMVEEVGQFAIRGGLLDVFSFGSPEPMRIEFWGDEVASIRFFDILDQRSTEPQDSAHILPVNFQSSPGDGHTLPRSLLELVPRETILFVVGPAEWTAELERTWSQVRALHRERIEEGSAPVPPSDLFLEPQQALAALTSFPRIEAVVESVGDEILHTAPPPPVDRDMARLKSHLREGSATGHRTLILCDNQGQCDRLEEIMGGVESIPPECHIMVGSLGGGFVLERSSPPLRVFTDHEVFRRTRRLRRARRFRGAVALESISQLNPGDFVVHMEHGIGVFKGLEHTQVAGTELEAMVIEYAGEEILRVPVYRLDLVERWVGETEDSKAPALHRIGGKRWKTLKRKTEAAIERMTAELLQLYALRETVVGFAFSPDGTWQKEMESSFLYEDTPDQRKAMSDVKRDMESSGPMDRLICGDVGYGKTEIAIRAAFKAVQDAKQVAVLAPTTVLVEQHRHTFEERLADYPVKIGALSRFRSASEQETLLAGLKDGTIDVVVGTHRLLSEDVTFKDLGLLIIDEEQRFGVKDKERLKQLRTSVDVLTLTATPIPRTLHLSLSGLRDLSLIQTPPRDRQPIITHVVPWSDQILSEALQRELDRGGQTFLLHNRVETIESAAEQVRALAPEASVAIAHGQMTPKALDKVMRDFVDGEVDVLVCSSIIENGLDVPNANTMIVDRADRFGLSQLYQIRGRVGRSDRRAYCYLVVPDQLSDEADKRLRVLEHYTELGSGYAVALKDLELRGAGNLLGGQQSGFAHAMGLDAYLRLLEQTVKRMKDTNEEKEYPEPEISLAGGAYLPDGYVSDSGQKLHLYRRLSKLRHQTEVQSLREELTDRFGEPPPEVERLLEGASLRILGRALGVERILVRDRVARVNFRPGVEPRLTVLERPLRDHQVEVEVRRLAPLSLALHRVGAAPLGTTIISALATLLAGRKDAA